MLTLLTTNNSAVLRQIASLSFERLGVDKLVATSGSQALAMVKEHKPNLCVLDAELPEMDGYEVCRRIKEDPGLRKTRVMIVLEGVIGRAQIERLAHSSCDDVFSVPAPSGELYQHVAKLCGLPSRGSRRIGVELRAELEAGARTIDGRVVNLSREGAQVEVDDPLTGLKEVRLRLFRSDTDRAAFTRAKVMWEKPLEGRPGMSYGVKFFDLPPDVRGIVDDLSLWEVTEADDGHQVVLQGDFTEITDFGPLYRHVTAAAKSAGGGPGKLEFDLSSVRYMNSSGVRNWITFLRRLSELEYRFVRCSVGFVSQAGMVPDVLGRGKVISLWAPYHCDKCDLSDERLLQVAALLQPAAAGAAATAAVGAQVVFPEGTDARVEPPRFHGGQCGGELVFDDLPERYFAFLSKTP
jgi:CheY-like chemotaxis protein